MTDAHPPKDTDLSRFRYAAPHLGPLVAFVPALIGAFILSYLHPVSSIAASFIVAGYSFFSAKDIMALQRRPSEWRGPTLYPYVWWGCAALLCFLVASLILFIVYPGANASIEEWTAESEWQTAAAVLQLSGWG